MRPNRKLTDAILTILGAHVAAAQAQGPSNSAAASNEIAEIVVTAQRRTESAQDIPITLQALTAETLTQLNVTTFDDFVRYLPNVESAGFGPGQSNIYMRGLATGEGGLRRRRRDRELSERGSVLG